MPGGGAWIIVTAQEDMDTVVGEMGKQQSNDFSKIQDRFANRMKLTSADVAEVIQKRLLTKTEGGAQMLTKIYEAQSNNFKTLFDFADGAQSYRNFEDQEHFVRSYPFIPYQFSLFQAAIQNLSQHNAFEGKHSSVGERSMLGVFQQVAINIADRETGQLATFDLMFEGIRSALKSSIQRAIIQAENHLPNPFAIRLLKALFLVKYVKEFKPTPRNLCILMLENFTQDLPALKTRIEEALGLLEQQTYVQRTGELYEYLTDEEKDIEQEIKNTEVEASDVAAELEKIVFDHVVKERKIRYDENGQDYPFSRKLDDRLHGREHELTIHVVSPFHEHANKEDILRMQSIGRDELLIVMPQDEHLVRDLLMYKKTEKYIRQNISIAQQETVKRILSDKASRNMERHAELKQHVQRLTGKANLFLAGNKIETGSGDAQTRLLHGFHELVARTYPNLRMLRGVPYTENDIAKYLEHSQQRLYVNDDTGLAESEQEILAFIQSNTRSGLRTTLKNLLEKFERKPYGWPYAAVLCMLVKLCARGKVDVWIDGNLLDDTELEQALRNSRGHGNTVLEPQVEFTASKVRALKEFYGDFFDAPPAAGEAKALGKETGAALRNLMDQLAPLAAQTSQYPFLSALTPVVEELNKLTGKPYSWYLTDLVRQKDALLATKESIIDPVRKFMSGSQKKIFDNARRFVQIQEPNLIYIEGDEAAQVDALLDNPECFKGDRMQQVKTHIEALQSKIGAEMEAEIAKAQETVTNLKSCLCDTDEFGKLNSEQQEQITLPFDEFNDWIAGQNLIAVIRDKVRLFEDKDYPRQLAQLTTWTQPGSVPAVADTPAAGQITEPKSPEYVSRHELQVAFEKVWLADEDDVDRYLKAMRTVLLDEIRKGKRIQV